MARLSGSSQVFRKVLRWMFLASIPNGLWEVAQLPLYTVWYDRDAPGIAFAVVHCLLGDMVVATALFLLAAAFLRDIDWVQRRPWLGGAVVTAAGVAFAVFSEWHNVYVEGSWAYAPSMPTIGGIGLSPLAQWLLIPTLLIALTRRFFQRNERG